MEAFKIATKTIAREPLMVKWRTAAGTQATKINWAALTSTLFTAAAATVVGSKAVTAATRGTVPVAKEEVAGTTSIGATDSVDDRTAVSSGCCSTRATVESLTFAF